MSTVCERKQRVKPSRFVRVELPVHGDDPGVITLGVGKLTTEYFLYRLASDFGRGWRLEKLQDGERYDVLLDGAKSTCECKGFLRWAHCKHIEGLQALVNAGKL